MAQNRGFRDVLLDKLEVNHIPKIKKLRTVNLMG